MRVSRKTELARIDHCFHNRDKNNQLEEEHLNAICHVLYDDEHNRWRELPLDKAVALLLSIPKELRFGIMLTMGLKWDYKRDEVIIPPRTF